MLLLSRKWERGDARPHRAGGFGRSGFGYGCGLGNGSGCGMGSGHGFGGLAVCYLGHDRDYGPSNGDGRGYGTGCGDDYVVLKDNT